MKLDEFLDRLRSEKGVVRAEVMPDDLCGWIVEEESTVTGAMGSMPVNNIGLRECMARDVRICVFEDLDFWHPDSRSMRMVDSTGQVVGHDLAQSEVPEFMERPDVILVSDDFVMYPEVEAVGDTTMEMLSVTYLGDGGWIPEDMEPVIWYPSTTSDAMIRKYFGHPLDETATGMLALNLR